MEKNVGSGYVLSRLRRNNKSMEESMKTIAGTNNKNEKNVILLSPKRRRK